MNNKNILVTDFLRKEKPLHFLKNVSAQAISSPNTMAIWAVTKNTQSFS